MDDVTRLLNAIEDGDSHAAEEILPAVYAELRALARQKMAGEPAGHTLQPTALVHEAWLRVAGPGEISWKSRAHFFAAAAEAMRRILVERARRKLAAKRGAGQTPIPLDSIEIPNDKDPQKLLWVHEVLDELAEVAPDQAEIVKLRFFVGMTHDEIARTLDISDKTSKRYWAHAKAWLAQRIGEIR